MIRTIEGLNGPSANETNQDALRHVAEALLKAKDPVVLVGRGILAAGGERSLLRLAELVPRAVFASTPSAKGAFPEDHTQAVGVFGFGGHKAAKTALKCADVLLIFGTQLLEQSSNGWSKLLNAPITFRFDVEATRLTAVWPSQRPIDGNLADSLPQLIMALERSPQSATAFESHVTKLNSQAIAQFSGEPSADRHVKPQALLAAINRVAPETTVCADAGNSMCWAIEWLRRRRPNTFHVSLDWGSMGFALPAAIGVSVSESNHVIAVTGDGSMAMSGGELHTAVEYALPVVVVVLNDRSAGMVRMGMDLWFGEHATVPDLSYRHCMNFALFARSLGAQGVCVTDGEAFEHQLATALKHPGPTLLDVHIDSSEVPNALSSRVESLRGQPATTGGGMC